MTMHGMNKIKIALEFSNLKNLVWNSTKILTMFLEVIVFISSRSILGQKFSVLIPVLFNDFFLGLKVI
jgi:hypothetical protein